MEYNNKLKRLRMPEYGRIIQNMVDHAVTLPSREERNLAVNTIIHVMGNINPTLRDNRDYKHKLWDHLHLIADFKLDIDSPFDVPTIDYFLAKPDRVPYPFTRIKIRHYGKIVELLIEKALEIPEEDRRTDFTRQIANHMKLSYLTWNKDNVTDEIILDALREVSGGRLTLPAGTILADVKELPPKTVPMRKRPASRPAHNFKKKY
ncbi:MAG: hypothetical protein A2X22_13750 [Bacteroidetes bacterium GWF2_49_14]|nr:MAG: hypothetical protein A2X22_13750 [Bacteroidetes bacterium GWF2_49_14]HBB93284.1 DUF4290 domain-containing protein [Bacteroidales bacterium]